MIQVIGSKRVFTRNSVYHLVLLLIDGKLKCVCRKIADRSFGQHVALPLDSKWEGTKLALKKGKRMQLGNLVTSEVLHIEDIPLPY